MRYRRLQRAGLDASEIGFGTWGLGGSHGGAVAYGPTDDRESLRALRRAWELGVTFYDTADLYGHGHSEVLLGQALAEVRGRAVIATKAGFLNAEGAQDFAPRHLTAALEGSLRRLGTEYVDLFLLHSPPLDSLRSDPGPLRWLEDVKRSGRARAIGISVRSPDDGLTVVRECALDAIQVNFNLADQRAARNGLLDLCAERGVGVIVRTPLCFGFLTGAFADPAGFDSSDHRSRWPAEQRARWHQAAEVFARFRADGGQTPAQFALRFCLSYPAVWTVIPGMLTAAQVEENVRASDLGPLTAAELKQVEEVYDEREFFLGREPGRQTRRPRGAPAGSRHDYAAASRAQ
ncbi:MAG TPA: aldo/keto reductase [Gemmataceae bacterium]|nr:aldo/keto reductase [Gemmataceae bacterium]